MLEISVSFYLVNILTSHHRTRGSHKKPKPTFLEM